MLCHFMFAAHEYPLFIIWVMSGLFFLLMSLAIIALILWQPYHSQLNMNAYTTATLKWFLLLDHDIKFVKSR
jgi:hypothetical protein